MEVSNNLKKQIIVEIIVLLLMASVAIYAYVAINKNSSSHVVNDNGLVLVLDDSNFTKLDMLSDGEGLEGDYVRYTVTNNNTVMKNIKLVVIPSIKEVAILNNIRMSVNDLYVNDLTEMEKLGNGYLVDEFDLSPGITRNYLFKYWYKLDTKDEYFKRDVKFEYKIVIED